jgi:hypothetical protein
MDPQRPGGRWGNLPPSPIAITLSRTRLHAPQLAPLRRRNACRNVATLPPDATRIGAASSSGRSAEFPSARLWLAPKHRSSENVSGVAI